LDSCALSHVRIGEAGSTRPDPINVVQEPIQVSIATEIINRARNGTLHSSVPAFHTIIQAGHSLGSIINNGVMIQAPSAIDAVVLTGYSHFVSSAGVAAADLVEANTDEPRFADLPDGYLTTVNESTRGAGFYGPPGTFDPRVLAFDDATKKTGTTGEVETVPVFIAAAPDFKGDVFTITGENDKIFCDPSATKCSNVAEEAKFYPAAKSVEFAIIPNTGHDLNLQLSVRTTYTTIQAWLDRHGY